MNLTISRISVWAAMIDDRPGGLSEKLAALSKAGANFEFVLARRSPVDAGDGVLFVAPVHGARQMRAAEASGFRKTDKMTALRIEATDKPTLGARITETLAGARINIRGFSAMSIGKRAVFYLAFDRLRDATKANRLLKDL